MSTLQVGSAFYGTQTPDSGGFEIERCFSSSPSYTAWPGIFVIYGGQWAILFSVVAHYSDSIVPVSHSSPDTYGVPGAFDARSARSNYLSESTLTVCRLVTDILWGSRLFFVVVSRRNNHGPSFTN